MLSNAPLLEKFCARLGSRAESCSPVDKQALLPPAAGYSFCVLATVSVQRSHGDMQVRGACLACIESALDAGVATNSNVDVHAAVACAVTNMWRKDKDTALRVQARKVLKAHGLEAGDGSSAMEM
jgi:hypothetical protein